MYTRTRARWLGAFNARTREATYLEEKGDATSTYK